MRVTAIARLVALTVPLIAGGCKTDSGGSKTLDDGDQTGTPNAATASAGVTSSPAIDPDLGEHLWDGEADSQQGIIQAITQSLQTRYLPNNLPMHRDAHPKAHGCVRATFQVNDTLPPNLAFGAFQPGKSYKAWMRFSNGDADPTRPDSKGDARGLAIKLIGVPGDKILDSEKSAQTQDFIMINYPVFFADNPVQYLSVIQKVNSSNPLIQLTAPIFLGIQGALIAKSITSLKIANPLNTRFWSMVGYRLGDDAHKQLIKFSARPCATVDNSSVPSNPDPSYLRQAMKDTLSQGSGCFEFLVQPATQNWMNPEDSTHEWTEDVAPFVKVATITIPQQTFDSDAQMTFCDNLSYTPWHALPEHRPLGAVNRARRVIYDAISGLRHDTNGAPRQEPTGDETF